VIGQTLLGRWTVEAKLGEGGMGMVYLARNPQGRRAAVKRLYGEAARDGTLVARFEREAEALAMLAHPNIAALEGVGASPEGDMIFVMEYVEGHDLGVEIDRVGRLPLRRAIDLTRQVLGALQHAHGFGLVHRDLKPENVLLGRSASGAEQIKMIDFGLVKMVGDVLGAEGRARLTATGVIFGTPAYMAPEQLRGEAVDARTDLYAVGVMLFELLTGRQPFVSDEIVEVWRAHVHAPVPRLREVDPALDHPDLDELIAVLMAKRPDGRFDSALAARRALESI
jgi:serine/threonine-protein kinase